MRRTQRKAGFTLLELLVVLTIIALASAGVVMSLRSGDDELLEREAVRLAALLEAGRAAARSTGVPVLWQPRPGGFELLGALPGADAGAPLAGTHRWLSPDLRAQIVSPADGAAVVLGPEPVLPAQAIRLDLNARQLWVGSDGFQPFAVQASPPARTGAGP